LIKKLQQKAYELGYSPNTPCWVVEKATWKDEKIYKGTLQNIYEQTKHINGIALIMLGEFLHQQESIESHLYTKPLQKELKSDAN
jgi:precorrin-4/cobalt-precorrin-4 C11-methyltransferase